MYTLFVAVLTIGILALIASGFCYFASRHDADNTGYGVYGFLSLGLLIVGVVITSLGGIGLFFVR